MGSPSIASRIKENLQYAGCYMVVQSEPCIQISRDEISAVKRHLVAGIPGGILEWERPKIWMIAVLVCPGDDLTEFIKLVKKLHLDSSRIHFYLHPETRIPTLKTWLNAGFALENVWATGREGRPINSWQNLHPLLGTQFNNQILKDLGQ